MEMANNNEEQAKNLQEQEAVIEIDVTDEAAQEVVEDDAKVEDVSEETEKSEQENEKENDSVADDVQKEVTEDESVEDTEEKKEESEPDEQQQESTDEGDTKADDTDDSVDKGEIEDVADEPSDKEKELMAQIEAYKEAEENQNNIREFVELSKNISNKLVEVKDAIANEVSRVAKQYNIPTDLSMEELEKQDPTKAEIAKNLVAQANQALSNIENELAATKESKAKDILFKRAEQMFKKYTLSSDQKAIAADTFIKIMYTTGIDDLDEDLAAKVKLSVAQAKMDSPDVVEVTQVKEEVKVEDVQNEEVKEEQAPAVEEKEAVEEEVEKAEEQKPDLSEFMEGIEGSAAKASDVNADNVLAKLNALPFKERTKFYKENMDLINEAMKNARGNL
jgi:PREDICTED: hypothetical protein